MFSCRVPALAVAGVLVVVGLVAPTQTAMAAPACPPVIEPASVQYSPSTVAVGSTGYATMHVYADVVADCATDNGSDLEVHAILTSPELFEGSIVFDPLDATYPTTLNHDFAVAFTGRVLSSELRNVDAGVWTTQLFVTDTDDEVHAYDDVQGPKVKILRASKITATAKASVKKGHSLKVTGKLTRADWLLGHDVVFAGQPVKLQFRPKSGGAWTTVKNLHSTSTGRIATLVVAKQDGWFRYAHVASTTTATALSAPHYVNVK